MFFYKYVHIFHNKHYLHYYKKKKWLKPKLKLKIYRYTLWFIICDTIEKKTVMLNDRKKYKEP